MGKHSSARDQGYRASYFDADHDIADAIEIVVTTPATGSYWLSKQISANTVVNVTVTEDVTIGAAGTAMVFYARNRQGDHPDDCGCDIEYGGTYTGGTEILSEVCLYEDMDDPTLLKQSTSYLITITSKADNNYTSAIVWVWEGGE